MLAGNMLKKVAGILPEQHWETNKVQERYVMESEEKKKLTQEIKDK